MMNWLRCFYLIKAKLDSGCPYKVSTWGSGYNFDSKLISELYFTFIASEQEKMIIQNKKSYKKIAFDLGVLAHLAVTRL